MMDFFFCLHFLFFVFLSHYCIVCTVQSSFKKDMPKWRTDLSRFKKPKLRSCLYQTRWGNEIPEKSGKKLINTNKNTTIHQMVLFECVCVCVGGVLRVCAGVCVCRCVCVWCECVPCAMCVSTNCSNKLKNINQLQTLKKLIELYIYINIKNIIFNLTEC